MKKPQYPSRPKRPLKPKAGVMGGGDILVAVWVGVEEVVDPKVGRGVGSMNEEDLVNSMRTLEIEHFAEVSTPT